MRLALILLVAGAATLAVVQLLPSGPRQRVDLKRQESGDRSTRSAPPLAGPVDPGSVSGSHVFSPQYRTATLDGRRIEYAAAYLWCRRLTPGKAEGRHELEDVRILVNPPPQTTEELEHLVAVDPEMSPEALGPALLRLMDEAPGVAAPRGVLFGGQDLASARRILLSGGVQANLVDPRRPGRRVRLSTPEITLEFHQGRLVETRSDGEVVLTGDLGRVTGRGLVVDLEARRLVLEEDISLRKLGEEARAPGLGSLEAAGPLVYALTEGGAGRDLRGPARVTIQGPAVLRERTEGITLEGGAIILFLSGGTTRVTAVRVQDGVLARTALGTLRGAAADYRLETDGTARLEVDGKPLTFEMARTFSFASGQDEEPLVIRTSGVARLVRGPGRPRPPIKATLGPGIELAGAGLDLRGDRLELEIAELPANSAGDPRMATRPYPVSARLLGGVKGSLGGPQGDRRLDLAGESLLYRRHPGEEGGPSEDTLTLEGSPHLAWHSPGDGGETPLGPGNLDLAAGQTLHVAWDPLLQEPVRVRGKGGVTLSHRPSGPGGGPELVLQASRASLLLAPVWSWLSRGAGGRFPQAFVMEQLQAGGGVEAAYGQRYRARGLLLSYERSTDLLRLEAGRPGRLAEVVFEQTDGREQVVRAPWFTYRVGLKRATAGGGTRAHMLLPPLQSLRDGSTARDPVMTTVDAHVLEAQLRGRDPASGGGLEVARIQVRSGVVARQEQALATCGYLLMEPGSRHLLVTGSPARVQAFAPGDPEKVVEFVEARRLVGAPEGLELSGDVRLRFRARRGETALDLLARGSSGGEEEAPDPIRPVHLQAGGRVFLTRRLLDISGGANVVRGDPAGDGFRLDAEHLLLFLTPPPEGSSRLRIFRAVAAGEVDFRSGDLRGRGDRMVFDVPHKVVALTAGGDGVDLATAGQTWPAKPAYYLDASGEHLVVSSLAPAGFAPPEGDEEASGGR